MAAYAMVDEKPYAAISSLPMSLCHCGVAPSESSNQQMVFASRFLRHFMACIASVCDKKFDDSNDFRRRSVGHFGNYRGRDFALEEQGIVLFGRGGYQPDTVSQSCNRWVIFQ